MDEQKMKACKQKMMECIKMIDDMLSGEKSEMTQGPAMGKKGMPAIPMVEQD